MKQYLRPLGLVLTLLLLAAGAFACTPWLGKLFQKCKDGIPGMAVLAALFWLCVWMLQREGQNPFLYLGF